MIKNKYFKQRNGEYYTKKTKEEIYSQIDNNNPQTFIHFLKEMDYPYIKQEWNILLNHYPNKKIFGRYCARMRLKGFRSLGFNDSDWLNEVRKQWY